MSDSDKTPPDVAPIPSDKLAAILAARLEGALASGSRSELESLHTGLVGMIRSFLAQAPADVREAVTGAGPQDSPLARAYLLGQISFAQTLAAQALSHRPDDDFFTILEDPICKLILDALGEDSLSTRAICQKAGVTESIVAVRLRCMQEAGVSDRREGDGGETLHFATPAAIAFRAASPAAAR